MVLKIFGVSTDMQGSSGLGLRLGKRGGRRFENGRGTARAVGGRDALSLGPAQACLPLAKGPQKGRVTEDGRQPLLFCGGLPLPPAV